MAARKRSILPARRAV